MRHRPDLLPFFPSVLVLSLGLATAATGCVAADDEPDLGTASDELGGVCVGGDVLSYETLTPADIPDLDALARAQIVAAVQESAHTDVTTVEEAFDRVDQHEINVLVIVDTNAHQFYTEIEFGAGDNSYGAIFYWGTAVKAGAIHDGYQEECGPITFQYGREDLAPECSGFLDYTNGAPFWVLDAYLPSNVAQAIVNARAVAPFDSVASVAAVNGVADSRLQQLLTAARIDSLVGPSCAGIFDQHALSQSEEAAMVAVVNEANREEIAGILSFMINPAVIDTVVTTRPYSNAAGIAATFGVGPAVFHALRNAATVRGPWDELVDAINTVAALHPDGNVTVDSHFEWRATAADPGYGVVDMNCFGGMNPSLVPPGTFIRQAPANSNELIENAGEAVGMSNVYDELAFDSTPGLTDLELRSEGAGYFGCYISYHPNPWLFDHTAFFVNTQTGESILIKQHYVE